MGFPLLGYDDERTYAFTIKPQFNELNFNEVMVDTLCNTWMLGNTSPLSNNFKRFNDNPVLSCVISLNRTELYTVDWTKTVTEHNGDLVNIIYNTLVNKFSTKHEQYYNTYLCVLKLNKNKGSRKILDDCKKALDDDKKIAPYISEVWDFIEVQHDEASGKQGKREIIEKYAQKDAFIGLFDRRLDKSLMRFLNMEEEEEEE